MSLSNTNDSSTVPTQGTVTKPISAWTILFWIGLKLWHGVQWPCRRWPYTCILLALGLIFFRPTIQPFFIAIAKHAFFALVMLIIAVIGLSITFFKHGIKWRAAASITTILVFVGAFFWGLHFESLLTLSARHKSLEIVKLSDWPLTDHERIQAFKSVKLNSRAKMTDTSKQLGDPDFVRDGDEYRWTIAVGPNYLPNQIFLGSVDEVFNISATDQRPNWDQRDPVNFTVGEQMLLSHNSETCAIRSLGPLKYLRYEPSEVRFMRRGKEYVQVISLTKWEYGLPWAENGGVIVVENEDKEDSWLKSLVHWFVVPLIGCGTWIPPEEIQNHEFLRGQNLLSVEVSRQIANSFRFQSGFTAPITHKDDIRIPVAPDDLNDQPFTTYFHDFPGHPSEKGLYHFFSLEPYSQNLQGFALAVMIPADGINRKVYTYAPRGLTGPSAIPVKVKESNIQVDWNNSHPIEQLPYVRIVNGERKFFFKTAVITRNVVNGKETVSEIPKIVLTDAKNVESVWIDLRSNKSWVDQFQEQVRKQK